MIPSGYSFNSIQWMSFTSNSGGYVTDDGYFIAFICTEPWSFLLISLSASAQSYLKSAWYLMKLIRSLSSSKLNSSSLFKNAAWLVRHRNLMFLMKAILRCWSWILWSLGIVSAIRIIPSFLIDLSALASIVFRSTVDNFTCYSLLF